MVATCCAGVRLIMNFFYFAFLVSVPVDFSFLAERLLLSGIVQNFEQYILKVFQYRFINWYDEF